MNFVCFKIFLFSCHTYMNFFLSHDINASSAVKIHSNPVPHLPSLESALSCCRSRALPTEVDWAPYQHTSLTLPWVLFPPSFYLYDIPLEFSSTVHVLIPITSFIPSIPFVWGHDATQVYVYSPSGFIRLINLHTHSIRLVMERTAVLMPRFHMNFYAYNNISRL